jgi:hypothetical protein
VDEVRHGVPRVPAAVGEADEVGEDVVAKEDCGRAPFRTKRLVEQFLALTGAVELLVERTPSERKRMFSSVAVQRSPSS